MRKGFEDSLLVVLACIFAMSLILNIGLMTKHIIIKDSNCSCRVSK